MEWIAFLESFGLPVAILCAVGYAAWWTLRQTVGKDDGWLRNLAARGLDRYTAFLDSLAEVQKRQVDLEARHFERTGELSECAAAMKDQHDAMLAAGLHACDVVEEICAKLLIEDYQQKVGTVREALKTANGGPPP